MKSKTMFVLMIIAALTFCIAVSQPAIASDEDDVLKVIKEWAESYNNQNMALMSSLYSPNISFFIPPKSGAFLSQGWESLENVVASEFEMPKGTISVSCFNTQATMLGNNHAVITGYIVFTFNPPYVTEQTVAQCRRTLVLQKINGKWLIVHEHASLFPTE